MSRRMTKAFNVCHLRAHFGSFAFFLHLLSRVINHEAHEGHGEFRGTAWCGRTLAIWDRGLPACSGRQLAEHKSRGQTSLQRSGSARVLRVGDDVSSSRTFRRDSFGETPKPARET